MSFSFDWPNEFPASFYDNAKNALEQALNAGGKLPLVADKILVQDLNLGSIPPELDLLGIDELRSDGSFQGRFMLSYTGNAFISLATTLHVNPLTQYKHALEILATPSVLLTTAEMFVQLTLSALRLRAVIVLSFSKKSGLSLTFKDDPLESLNVSSSFDSIGVIHRFIQGEIENQLRERFRRDLPSLIHRLSQRWLADIGQQPPTSTAAPIVVEREREPDDSFHYGDEEEDNSFEMETHDQDSHAKRTMRSPSPALSSDSDLDVSEEENGTSTEGEATASDEEAKVLRPRTASFATTRSFSGHMAPSPAGSPTKSSPLAMRPIPPHSRTVSSTASTRSGTDSPILRSLQRNNSTFATTFSEPPAHTTESDSDLPKDLTSLLLSSSPGDRKATRKRFHRLESSSPSTSPQKSKSAHKSSRVARERIISSDMDEYFPVRTSDGPPVTTPQKAPPPPKPDFGASYGNNSRGDNAQRNVMGRNRAESASKPSLRRNMLSQRLRESNYFTPNYPS